MSGFYNKHKHVPGVYGSQVAKATAEACTLKWRMCVPGAKQEGSKEADHGELLAGNKRT